MATTFITGKVPAGVVHMNVSATPTKPPTRRISTLSACPSCTHGIKIEHQRLGESPICLVESPAPDLNQFLLYGARNDREGYALLWGLLSEANWSALTVGMVIAPKEAGCQVGLSSGGEQEELRIISDCLTCASLVLDLIGDWRDFGPLAIEPNPMRRADGKPPCPLNCISQANCRLRMRNTASERT